MANVRLNSISLCVGIIGLMQSVPDCKVFPTRSANQWAVSKRRSCVYHSVSNFTPLTELTPTEDTAVVWVRPVSAAQWKGWYVKIHDKMYIKTALKPKCVSLTFIIELSHITIIAPTMSGLQNRVAFRLGYTRSISVAKYLGLVMLNLYN